jgi:hypothetical protein
MRAMTLRKCFNQHRGRYVAKIDHFFDVYEKHFSRFRDKPLKLLEIGVDKGGSLELWQNYFGPQCEIHGIDINPAVVEFAPEEAILHIGSQDSPDFIESVARDYGPFDIVIDDGSHLMRHQIDSFELIYPQLEDHGIYVCEDAFTSYWREFGGQLGGQHTFMEYAKGLIDQLHAYWAEDDALQPSAFTRTTSGIHFYSGAVVFERQPVSEPVYIARHKNALGNRYSKQTIRFKFVNYVGYIWSSCPTGYGPVGSALLIPQ